MNADKREERGCHNCAHNGAWIEGSICPMYQIGACDSSKLTYFTPEFKFENEGDV